jgi:hypothetical protein
VALLTDDCDITDCHFWMEWGGNGDPYIILMETEPKFKKMAFRFAMSGGNTCRLPRVLAAVIELYRAMEEAGLNKHPKDDKITNKP